MFLGDCYDAIFSYLRKNKVVEIKDYKEEIIPGKGSNFGRFYAKVTLADKDVIYLEMIDGRTKEIQEEVFYENKPVTKREKFVSSVNVDLTQPKKEEPKVSERPSESTKIEYENIHDFAEENGIKIVRLLSREEGGKKIRTIITDNEDVIVFEVRDNKFVLMSGWDVGDQSTGAAEPR